MLLSVWRSYLIMTSSCRQHMHRHNSCYEAFWYSLCSLAQLDCFFSQFVLYQYSWDKDSFTCCKTACSWRFLDSTLPATAYWHVGFVKHASWSCICDKAWTDGPSCSGKVEASCSQFAIAQTHISICVAWRNTVYTFLGHNHWIHELASPCFSLGSNLAASRNDAQLADANSS